MRSFVQKALLVAASISFSGVASAASDYLDYGLYWFEGDNSSVKAVEHDGTVNTVPSNYYSDSKKTMILFHGWQQGTSSDNYRREGFYFDYAGVQMAQAWKDKGWNVGLFYWNQFADENEVKDAEAKIWTANGPRGMRYRLSDGSYSSAQSGNTSVGQIAFAQVSAALAHNTSGNIRFAGHSLGNQLATYTAKQIHSAIPNSNAMPNRIDLLDPFWSKGGKSYLADLNNDGNDDWVGERVRWYLADMIASHDIASTWYKGSAIHDLWIGDANNELKDIVALVYQRMWYLGGVLDLTSIAAKHVHSKDEYLLSMGSQEPLEVTISGWFKTRYPTGNIAASAATCDARIKQMMGSDLHWDQVEGRYTVSTDDDMFEVKGNFDPNAPSVDCN